jgi:hypothetical protein
MDKIKDNMFQITEMFMAQADNERCFFSCIKSLKDDNGNPFVFSRIVMPDGLICANAIEQKQLGTNLDEIAIMRLDIRLYSNAGVTTKIFFKDFFFN